MSVYKVSIGRTLDTTNLVTNGNFAAGLAGWSNPSGLWVPFSGFATLQVTNNNTELSQDIFTLGEMYQVNYTYAFLNSGVVGTFTKLALLLGDYGKQELDGVPGILTVLNLSEEQQIVKGTKLDFRGSLNNTGGSVIGVDNVTAFQFLDNPPLNDEPRGLDKFERVLERESDKIRGVINASSISTLEFWGDGYLFLKSELNTNGPCSKVPIRIEKSCGGGQFKQIFFGEINLIEAEFDEVACVCKVKTRDRGARQTLNENKDTLFSYSRPYIAPIYPNDRQDIEFHDAAGAYPGVGNYTNVPTYRCGITMERIIGQLSERTILFESSFLNSGTFEFFALSTSNTLSSALLGSTNLDTFKHSFNSLFDLLNSIFNLGISIFYTGKVPTIKIEPKEDLFGTIVQLQLQNVTDLRLKFDFDLFPRIVNIGYEYFANSENNNGQQYRTEDSCAQDVLNIVSKSIKDSNTIFGILANTIGDSDISQKWVVVQNDGVQTSQFNRTLEGGGAFDYNGDIDFDDNMARWIDTLQASSYIYDQQGVQGIQAPTINKTNAIRLFLYTFRVAISDEDFDLLNDLTEKVSFNSPSNGIESFLEGFIFSIKREENTTIAKVELIAET